MKKITLLISSIILLFSCKTINNNDIEKTSTQQKASKSIDLQNHVGEALMN